MYCTILQLGVLLHCIIDIHTIILKFIHAYIEIRLCKGRSMKIYIF